MSMIDPVKDHSVQIQTMMGLGVLRGKTVENCSEGKLFRSSKLGFTFMYSMYSVTVLKNHHDENALPT